MTARVRRPRARRHSAAVLVLTTAAVMSCGRSDDDPSAAPPESAASGTRTPSADSRPIGPAPGVGPDDAVRTVVISDQGGSTTAGGTAWPDLLQARLGSAGVPMDVVTTAQDGAGFTSSPSFADLVGRLAEGSTQLVVLFDSLLDVSGALPAAAEATFTAVERAAPDALLVVVGPLTAEGTAPGAQPTDLAAAAQRAGGTYVDPRAEGWSEELTQPELATLLEPHLQPLIDVLAASGANR